MENNMNYELHLVSGEVIKCRYEDETDKRFIIKTVDGMAGEVDKSNIVKLMRSYNGEKHIFWINRKYEELSSECNVCNGNGFVIMYQFHKDTGNTPRKHRCGKCQPNPWDQK